LGEGIQDLGRSLRSTVDGARDPGAARPDEFASFLSKLLTGLQPTPVGLGPAAAPAVSSPGAATALRFDGFDLARPQDPQRSAKDAFAMLARQAGSMPAPAEAEAWFSQHVAPGMSALGHQIDWVKGHRFQFTNWQGTFAVEFLRGGGSQAALAWGLE
jgi:hypothetical protein